jgi:hypothetical protein
MARKRKIAITDTYIVKSFSDAPILYRQFFKLGYALNILILGSFTVYYLGALNMIDKLFTFIISGKVIGTDYVLKFSDVCWISAAIVASLLIKSIFSYLRVAKNRNKIRLQITEAYPMSLKVRVTA